MAKNPLANTDPNLAKFLWALRQQESGGNYKAGNPSGAVGAYQILASNIPSWSQEALGHSISTQEFLNSPALQDQIAEKIAGDYFRQYGPEKAASAWYSGNPNLYQSTKPQPGGPSIADYVSSVIKHMTEAPDGLTLPLSGSTATGTGSSTGGDSGVTQAGLLDFPKDIVSFFIRATDSMTASFQFFHALFQPSTYVRAGAGMFGFIFLIAAIVLLYKTTKES